MVAEDRVHLGLGEGVWVGGLALFRNSVGDLVAGLGAEDELGGVDAVVPEGECGQDVSALDFSGAVHEGIDEGEAEDLGGGAVG